MSRHHDQLEFPVTTEDESEYSSPAPLEKEEYRVRLAQKLKESEFRKTEGFPLGADEDILTLSDPPFYTACPNPFLEEILELWQEERSATRKRLELPLDASSSTQHGSFESEGYHRDPFAADVSEGKNDPIYNAHSYHTKVPHKGIMRYILHFTDPGDIIFDGFCGTGMTGVAARLCGDKKAVESLGYHVQKNGVILDAEGKPFSHLGVRKAVLVDLSPAATFIAYNYNSPVDARAFEREAHRILQEVEGECGWMFETWHPNCTDPQRVKGRINYTVWSDIFLCPTCGREMVFFNVAMDQQKGQVKDQWPCPGCGTLLSKSPAKNGGAQKVQHSFVNIYDQFLKQSNRHAKKVPVLINYTLGKKRYEKKPDEADLELIQHIQESDIPYDYPSYSIPQGDKTADPFNIGVTHVHHFYTKRNIWVLAAFFSRIIHQNSLVFKQWFTASLIRTSKMYKFTVDRKMGTVTGTLYIPSLNVESNPAKLLQLKKTSFSELNYPRRNNAISFCQSSSNQRTSESKMDYLFVDPPFGGNIMYSELNFLWEAWLKVFTNNKPEAIINRVQHKKLPEYQALMEACFLEFFRALKPGRWMTVEFHNSQNSVWNAIEEGLLRAGFMVADVRVYDKKQGSFNQVNASGAVKKDLIISAYKPSTQFETRFVREAGTVEGAWDFTRQHLRQLPLPPVKKGVIEFIEERMPYLLYDRMVAFHIQRGFTVPLSAPDFYNGLTEKFLSRDGMAFLPDQTAEYDSLRLQAKRVEQLALFVSDERTAIQWLHRELDKETGNGPQTYQDLQPKFLQELHQSRHEKLPELMEILEQNFLQDEDGQWYVPSLEKAGDLEKLREKSLLREFEDAVRSKSSLHAFRGEAFRYGFHHAWQEHQYEKIVSVAERLPEAVLQEDSALLMYYHNARLRVRQEPKQEKLL